ncbi:hypothetical protein ACHAWF_016668 [Thalassiosira exigua]
MVVRHRFQNLCTETSPLDLSPRSPSPPHRFPPSTCGPLPLSKIVPCPALQAVLNREPSFTAVAAGGQALCPPPVPQCHVVIPLLGRQTIAVEVGGDAREERPCVRLALQLLHHLRPPPGPHPRLDSKLLLDPHLPEPLCGVSDALLVTWQAELCLIDKGIDEKRGRVLRRLMEARCGLKRVADGQPTLLRAVAQQPAPFIVGRRVQVQNHGDKARSQRILHWTEVLLDPRGHVAKVLPLGLEADDQPIVRSVRVAGGNAGEGLDALHPGFNLGLDPTVGHCLQSHEPPNQVVPPSKFVPQPHSLEDPPQLLLLRAGAHRPGLIVLKTASPALLDPSRRIQNCSHDFDGLCRSEWIREDHIPQRCSQEPQVQVSLVRRPSAAEYGRDPGERRGSEAARKAPRGRGGAERDEPTNWGGRRGDGDSPEGEEGRRRDAGSPASANSATMVSLGVGMSSLAAVFARPQASRVGANAFFVRRCRVRKRGAFVAKARQMAGRAQTARSVLIVPRARASKRLRCLMLVQLLVISLQMQARTFDNTTTSGLTSRSQLFLTLTQQREEKDQSIIVGGTMAGQFMAGLSGGQRKLLLFELIVQRTASQENLLIVLDEPFAGVTDDFIPFIVKRLEEMRIKHNVLLVTNDHVETLKNMADNTITVSAIKRNEVKVNGKEGVERDLALLAMSIGDDYKGGTGNQDLEFFRRVELSKNGGIVEIAAFTAFLFGLFLLTFWDSKPGSEALVLIAGGLVTYFSIQPYFLHLGDWRVFMTEEAEALLHSSKSMNKLLKSSLTLFLLVAATCVQFGCQAAVIKTITTPEIFVEIYGAMPFLFMIFFSTTFSPGAGVPGLKELRYLFPRYYMWCMLPEGAVTMEGCPESHLPLYLVLSALLVPITFSLYKATNALYKKFNFEKKELTQRGSMTSYEFAELQMELFGAKALENLKRIGSTHDLSSIEASIAKSKLNLTEHTKRASEDGQEYDDFLTILNKSDTGSPNAEAGDDRV